MSILFQPLGTQFPDEPFISLRNEWHCRMAGKDLRQERPRARISGGANPRRTVPAKLLK